jgi:hypothetical protein
MNVEKMIVGGLLVMFVMLVGGWVHTDYQIATASDPIVMACAMNREKACIAVAARR